MKSYYTPSFRFRSYFNQKKTTLNNPLKQFKRMKYSFVIINLIAYSNAFT